MSAPDWSGRGRAARATADLLEREGSLRLIEDVLDVAADGGGSALLLDGHAGMGKTRLHGAAIHLAQARGLRVLRAAGAELERNLAFGVVSQLLQALLSDLDPASRRTFLGEAPERVRSLAGRELAPAGRDGDLMVSHNLFTVLAGVAEAQPALLAIDDLHWCDVASLEFLLYVLHRLDELPVALVMARRPGIVAEGPNIIDRIATHPRIRIEDLKPLGGEAVRQLVHEALGARADQTLIDACLEATAGNPFYLHELLVALSEDADATAEELIRRARALAPDAVTTAVRVRVGRLGHGPAALARAIAILAEDVPLRRAAALAGISIDEAAEAADQLAAVEVLCEGEPLVFVHPLVRRAIERDVPASERGGRHRDAARLLYAEGEGPERVAAHLLSGRAEGDGWAVGQLRAAAGEARDRGAWHSAVRYLQRALAEPPTDQARIEVLAELGTAEAAIGAPAAADHLAEASEASGDPRRRAELAWHRGRSLDAQGLHEEAAQAYDKGLRELPTNPTNPDELELRDQLQADFVAAGMIVPTFQERALELSALLLDEAVEGPRTQGQRLRLAQAATQAAFAGEPAQMVIQRAERAWDGGRLLEHGTARGIGWRLVATAFCLAGELERSVAVASAAVEDARQRSWPLAFATASFFGGLPRLWEGRVDDAMGELELARDAQRYGWQQFSRAAAAHYSLCLIEKHQLELAETVLSQETRLELPSDLEDALAVYALSELRLAQGRPAEALDSAIAAGEVAERSVEFFGYCPWRTVAAQAVLSLGDPDRALRFAHKAAARAKQTQVFHQRIRTLRVLGVCQGGDAGLQALESAVRLALDGPPRMETIYALIELGAALRRANRRAAAREPLQQAADRASRGGARAAYERARIELAATGARPRREAFLSGPASLTPSERRIAELAAGGQTNREIAHALFVTPKTVEYHLRNAYRKLDIEARGELAEALK